MSASIPSQRPGCAICVGERVHAHASKTWPTIQIQNADSSVLVRSFLTYGNHYIHCSKSPCSKLHHALTVTVWIAVETTVEVTVTGVGAQAQCDVDELEGVTDVD